MKRYYVIDVKGDVNGFMTSNVVAELHVKDPDGKEFYLLLDEYEGMPEWFKSDVPLFEKIIDPDLEDMDQFDEYRLDIGDYDEVLESKDADLYPLLKFLAYIVVSDWDVYNQYANKEINKYIDEIDVPDEEEWE